MASVNAAVLEQAEHLHRRNELLEALGQRAKAGSQPGNQKASKNKGADSAPLFQTPDADHAPKTPKTTADLAAEMGMNQRSAQERMQVARDLAPEMGIGSRQVLDILSLAGVALLRTRKIAFRGAMAARPDFYN